MPCADSVPLGHCRGHGGLITITARVLQEGLKEVTRESFLDIVLANSDQRMPSLPATHTSDQLQFEKSSDPDRQNPHLRATASKTLESQAPGRH